MLHSLREIHQFHFRTIDGQVGDLKAFLIDDFNWAVRYAVGKIGDKQTLIAMSAFDTPDLEHKVFPVNISIRKIMGSPQIDLDQSLSREIERQIHDYYEWPYYWEGDDVPNTLPGDLTAVPLIDMELEREEEEEELEEELAIPQTGSDLHLHSTQRIFGSTIHTTNDDENAGRLADMIVQDEDWNILYLVVDTGDIVPRKQVLVSPSWVQDVDELDSHIDVDLKKKTIRESPDFRTVMDITDEYQSRLSDYYKLG